MPRNRTSASKRSGIDSAPARRTIDLDGPVSYVDFGGEGDPLILVHGLGGAIEGWLSVGERLAQSAHTVAVDLRGFGHTPLTDKQSAGVFANQELLNRFIAALFDEPVTLVGNSMGGMISILQASENPDSVRRLVLVDPSLPYPEGVEGDPTIIALFSAYVTPGVGEELMQSMAARMSPEEMVRQTLALCCVDADRVDPDVVDAQIEIAQARAEMDWASAAHLEAARSLVELNLQPDNYYDRIRSLRAPALVIHGERDRFIPVAAARVLEELRPDWELQIFDDIGHTPMLESPDRFVDSVASWLEGDIARSPEAVQQEA